MKPFDAMLVVAIIVLWSLLLRKPVEDWECNGVWIEGCTFHSVPGMGIQIHEGDASDVKIENCTFRDDAHGIPIRPGMKIAGTKKKT